jgi:MarR family transcriptional regulator, organic hydroperoxide resistance regulator
MTKGTEPLSEESLTYELVDSIFRVAAASHAQVADLMAELDITTALANVLWKLDPREPLPSMRDLGVMLRCDPSTVTFMVERLHAKGLVSREVDPENRRVKRISLTAKGRKVRVRLIDAMIRRSPIAQLSGEDQRQLLALISKVSTPL